MIVKSFNFHDENSLKAAFDIRRKVFVEEQKVKDYEEFDEFEKSCVHYLAMEGDRALGTARWRITADGVKLERFAVLNEERGKGVGKALLSAVMKDFPSGIPVYLHAQITALDFYEKAGFEKTGPEFTECEIRHFKMTGPELNQGLTLDEAIEYVHEFHRAFRLNREERPTADIAPELVSLRHKLMHEENEEYRAAAEAGDLVEVADALGDMLYILCGTIISHGMRDKIGEVFAEIQRSNMSKLDANGNPIYREDGKVMKSELYFKPDIASILKSEV